MTKKKTAKGDTSAEQMARDLLERIGVEDAQSFSSGDLVELANLIREQRPRSATPETSQGMQPRGSLIGIPTAEIKSALAKSELTMDDVRFLLKNNVPALVKKFHDVIEQAKTEGITVTIRIGT
jgi:hypothetical protein